MAKKIFTFFIFVFFTLEINAHSGMAGFSDALFMSGITNEISMKASILSPTNGFNVNDLKDDSNIENRGSVFLFEPPLISSIPGQIVAEGENFSIINLNRYVSDPDHHDRDMSWSYSGNEALRLYISSLNYVYITIPEGWYGSETITFTVTDPEGESDSASATFIVSHINVGPQVTDIPDQTIAEGSLFAEINLNDYVSDPDHDDAEMTWTVTGNDAIDVRIGTDMIATITPPHANWNGSESLTFRATDPEGASDIDEATFRVTAVNDIPVLYDIEATSLEYTAGNGVVPLTNSLAITDIDNATLNWAMVQFTSGYVQGEDRLVFTGNGGISGVFDPEEGSLTLTGSNQPVSAYQTAVRAVGYENTSDDPSAGTRVIRFMVNDGSANSNQVTRNITINSIPELSITESGVLIYCSNSGPAGISNSIVVSDDNDAFLRSASVAISEGYVNGMDFLGYTSYGSINGTFNESTGILDLSGRATTADYELTLRSITFEHTGSVNQPPLNRTILYTISDGKSESNILGRDLRISAPIRVAGQNYFEDFEEGEIIWTTGSSGLSEVNSWAFGMIERISGDDPQNQGWYTDIANTTPPAEQSWVMSPCFDLTGMEHPMIILNIKRQFNSNRDGANLQITTDNGFTWQNIGELQDGINWYNENNISGNPGGEKTGWSSVSDEAWIESRHTLDDFTNDDIVFFRIAYGSDGTAINTGGIAFDNLRIAERDKTVLVEHFTNTSDLISGDADQIVNELVNQLGNSAIDLQYHTAFPGPDPFNSINPSPTDARILYYGVSQVPFSVLDGGTRQPGVFDYKSESLNEKSILIKSLYDSKFTISLYATASGNLLQVEAEIQALQQIPLSELTLHLVLIEEKIVRNTEDATYHSVVKAMLPDPAGSAIYKSWASNERHLVDLQWGLQHVNDPGELRIVAFIQDESTKEIYQAAMDTVEILSAITNLPEENTASSVIVYPDPASEMVMIRLANSAEEPRTLEMINSLGMVVFAVEIPEDVKEIRFPVQHFQAGTYYIRLKELKGTIPLIIVH